MAEWNPYDQTKASDFFDPWWMFGIKDGFDVVIGNPPYVSAPTMVDSNPALRRSIIDSERFIALYQKWDLYIPFVEIGIQLLASNGQCAMIVPYPMTNQNYAKKLRELIVKKYNLVEIVDLNGTKIFENATVSNCIPFISKSPPNSSCFISHIDNQKVINRVFRQPLSALIQDEKTAVWNLTAETRTTNRHSEMNILGDFCYISVGMVLNADEKTARGEFSKDDLISEIHDDIHSRKYIEAKDIEKYRVKKIRYLEYDTERCPGKLRRPTFRKLYEKPKLMFNRLGNLTVILDSKTKFLHSDSMFSAVLWKDLKGTNNKSISTSITRYSRFSRKEMEALSHQVDLRYLLGLLNSRYAVILLSTIRGGDYHIYPEHLRNLPIPLVPMSSQRPVIALVDKIIAAKAADPQSDTTELEQEIDNLVYRLYNLTHGEVVMIEQSRGTE
ncbi:MAG: Eco57I restriction-modification methylase domain-containing protein [Bacteroidales bacterium]|nr:Eco57I restriction-modification methylase domain-containing protein [Bacteroidales bacterium]